MSVNNREPTPVANDTTPIWDLVIDDTLYGKIVDDDLKQSIAEDMLERDRLGVEKYGVHLQKYNGRNPMVDAIQELYDGLVYMRQAIAEEWDCLLENRQIKNIEMAYGKSNGSQYDTKNIGNFVEYCYGYNLSSDTKDICDTLSTLLYVYGLQFEAMESLKRLLLAKNIN
jgi:hypothetical protein